MIVLKNILAYAYETYVQNIKYILLFSLSFVIASIIPIFAAFPTYNDIGAIFIRTASVYSNFNLLDISVIVASTLFSLLFLSFAVVAITTIIKHKRTSTRITAEIIKGLEKYTGRVFAIMILFTLILMAVDVLSYPTHYSGPLTAIIGLVLTPFLIYAPYSIVIDENRIGRAIGASARFFSKRFDYFLIWLLTSVILLSAVDLIFIMVGGTMASRYLVLVVDSLFVLPFLVVLQAEMYMRRFAMLKR